MVSKCPLELLMAKGNLGQRLVCTVDLSCDLCWCADDEDVECPPELLVPKGIMADLCGESAKLKSMNVMNQVFSIFRFS